MNLWHLILLLVNSFYYWTPATADGTYRPIMRGYALVNVEITGDPITVNLSNSHIIEIRDKALDALKNVKVLDLSGNGMINLPFNLFSKLNNLRELSLACSNTPFYSDGFHGLNNLMHLDLSGRDIFNLNRGYFAGLPKSVNITVSPGSINDISTAIFKNPSDPASEVEDPSTIDDRPLKRSTNPRRVTNDTMTYSYHQIFDFTRNLIENLPSNIKNLDLNHNRLFKIRRSYARNDHLTTLILDSNQITAIEDNAFDLLKITSLSLKYNRLSSTNFIRTLPTTIEKLDLSANLIEEILPGTFSRLRNLKVLTMHRNKLKSLQPGTFDGPEDLQKIDFMTGRIKKIHPGAFRGLRLLMLGLYLNKLEIIESGAFSDMSCGYLNLGWNDISSVEEGAFSGANIHEISFWGNRMTEFKKESLNGISGIRKLSLHDNPVKRIEKGSMLNLKEAIYVNLARTKLEVLENGMLFGLSDEVNVRVRRTPIKLIQGGVFDDF